MTVFILQNKKQYAKWCGLIIGLAIWQLLAYLVDSSLILPSIPEVAHALTKVVESQVFWPSVQATIGRIVITLIIDSVIALALAIPAGMFSWIEAFFLPYETVMRSIPTMGILLLSLIWFTAQLTPLFVASLIALPILYRGLTNGIKNIDYKLEEMSVQFSVPFWRKVLWLYLPSIKPFAVTAYSASLGLLVKVMVTAEVLSQPKYGVGTQLQEAKAQLDTATIFAWSVLVIVFASILELIMKRLLATKGKK